MEQVICWDGGSNRGTDHQNPRHQRVGGGECKDAISNFPIRITTAFLILLILKVRSGMLRAVAKLIVITDMRDTNLEMAEKHFDVIELPDINDMEE